MANEPNPKFRDYDIQELQPRNSLSGEVALCKELKFFNLKETDQTVLLFFVFLGNFLLNIVCFKQYCHYPCSTGATLSVRPSVDDMVSGAKIKFALEFWFRISHAWWWSWAEANWFSATSLTKWPPGGHIGFFGFQTLTWVWLSGSTPNFSGTILLYMDRSLLIFSNVIFKMAAWRPYLIFRFLDFVGSMVSGAYDISNSLWNFNFKFDIYVDGGHGQKSIDFLRRNFKMAAWQPYWIVLVSGLYL